MLNGMTVERFEDMADLVRVERKKTEQCTHCAFSHHYQGRIDFNTVNLFHSTGMHLACILARREGLTNPLP